MKLYLLRHAESISNTLGIIDSIGSDFDKGLSEKGKNQAIMLVKELEAHKFDIVIVSPLKRTFETLKPYIDSKKDIKVVTSKMVLEINNGEFIGKPKGSIDKYCKDKNILDIVSFKPKQGESISDAYNRAKIFINLLRKKFTNKCVLVCSHSGFIHCLDMILNNIEVKDFFKYPCPLNAEIKDYTLK